MKSHTELLIALIDALYEAPLSKETHDLKMLAAETRGQMVDESDSKREAAIENLMIDGRWIANTGTRPECELATVRFANGKTEPASNQLLLSWGFGHGDYNITHYKPR